MQDVEANNHVADGRTRHNSAKTKEYEDEYQDEDDYQVEVMNDDPYQFNNYHAPIPREGERNARSDGWRSICILCTFCSCSIILGLSIGLGKASSTANAPPPPPEKIIISNPPTYTPTIAPTKPPEDFTWCYESNESTALDVEDTRYASIRSALVSSGISTDNEFADDASYQRKSLCWLSFGDRLELDAADPFLEQRYALATIYYGMNEPSTMLMDGWLSGKPECEWQPLVECDARSDTTVTRLSLNSHNLQPAVLPHEMAALNHVTYLDMSTNFLDGDISATILGWTHLEELNLSNNLFKNIPSSVDSWKSLKRLDVSTNEILDSIPESLALLTDLEFLDISTNEFFGEIPSVLGNLASLKRFYAHGNELEGFLPIEICNLRVEAELQSITTDCRVPSPEVECVCCTACNDYDIDRDPWG